MFSSAKVDGLCCLLTHPYRDIQPITSINEHHLLELNRSRIVQNELFDEVNELYQGKYGQRHVSIKSMKIDHQDSIDKFLEEAKILHKLSHKNLVYFYGVCTQDKPILIIIESLINGSLLKYLRNTNFKIQNIFDFIAQVNQSLFEKNISSCFRLSME